MDLMHTKVRLCFAIFFAWSLGFGLAACQKGDPEKAKACAPIAMPDCSACCTAAGFGAFAFTTQLRGTLCECA